MPVQLLVSVNGGGPQSGGIDVPSEATIQLSAASIVGWKQQRWEIYDYPEGFATPSGWTLQGDGTISSTDVAPTLITLPSNNIIWGPWGFRLKIDEAVVDDDTEIEGLVDEATAIHMASPTGLRKPMALEDTQFCTATTLHKKWVRTLQRMANALANPMISTTSDSTTPVRIRRYPVGSEQVKIIRAIIKARGDGDASVYGDYDVKAAYKVVAGVLAQLYAPVITTNGESAAGLNVTLTLNGNTDVDLNVVGLAATDIIWEMRETFF